MENCYLYNMLSVIRTSNLLFGFWIELLVQKVQRYKVVDLNWIGLPRLVCSSVSNVRSVHIHSRMRLLLNLLNCLWSNYMAPKAIFFSLNLYVAVSMCLIVCLSSHPSLPPFLNSGKWRLLVKSYITKISKLNE